MRSSNYKHLKNDRSKTNHSASVNKVKKFSKIGSLIFTAFIVISAIVIPCVSYEPDVAAVSGNQNSTINLGDTNVYTNEVAETKKETAKPTEPAVEKETEPEIVEETEPVYEETVEETVEEVVEETEPVSYSSGNHIELSDYDRALLEGLVMGEAGGYGYEGAALVAQAIHDSMIESGTTSVEYIAAEYQYDASMSNVPSEDVKSAVSFIFDCDGRAVDHRILYFYASDIVTSDWHESQNFITSCGSMRFFDKW